MRHVNEEILKIVDIRLAELELMGMNDYELMRLYVDKILVGRDMTDIFVEAINNQMKKRGIVPLKMTIGFKFTVNGKEKIINGVTI